MISRVLFFDPKFASQPPMDQICLKPPSEGQNPCLTLFRKKCAFLTCNDKFWLNPQTVVDLSLCSVLYYRENVK
eukprot:UN00855